MWGAVGPKTTTDKFIKYKIPTKAGQSGSPIIKRQKGKESIVGVHIGNKIKEKKNVAVRLTPEKKEMIAGWIEEIYRKELKKFLEKAKSQIKKISSLDLGKYCQYLGWR